MMTLKERQNAAIDFSDLEKIIEKDGLKILRSLLEAHITWRGLSNVGPPAEGYDGIFLSRHGIGKRQIKSIFGTIEFGRLRYSCCVEQSLFPKNAYGNLPDEHSQSHELQKYVALEVIKGSYDQAVENSDNGMGIPKQQVEHLTVRVGIDFEAFQLQNLADDKLEAAKLAPLQVLTMDGKRIVMRKDDLRSATRKKAES